MAALARSTAGDVHDYDRGPVLSALHDGLASLRRAGVVCRVPVLSAKTVASTAAELRVAVVGPGPGDCRGSLPAGRSAVAGNLRAASELGTVRAPAYLARPLGDVSRGAVGAGH